MDCRCLLFDLDGTPLRSDKSISPCTLRPGRGHGECFPAVKAAAELVIGTNDEDGIAQWLEAAYR